MKWLMALMLLATVTFSGSAIAKYQVGIVQPFAGLACRTQESAEHIFSAWKAGDASVARMVFQVYQGADECRFFRTYSAYFVEKLDSMEAANFEGKMQTVLLFSIAPSQDSDIRDYLVTWEPLLPPGDVI